jgi:pimeloyl-ACP methyl ester carboxylesterase
MVLSSSEGQEKFFTGGCTRLMIEGAGHFLPREAPDVVAKAVISHFRSELHSTARGS